MERWTQWLSSTASQYSCGISQPSITVVYNCFVGSDALFWWAYVSTDKSLNIKYIKKYFKKQNSTLQKVYIIKRDSKFVL